MKIVRVVVLGIVLVAGIGIAACSSTPPTAPMPDATLPPLSPVGAESSSATGAPAPSAPPSASAAPSAGASASPPAGKPCVTSQDCGKGEMCSGDAGCDAVWTCQPARPCTRDLVRYCGCDGKTFQGSSTCPLQKWKARGACPP